LVKSVKLGVVLLQRSNEPAVFGLNPANLQNQALLPHTNGNAFFRLAAP
jgi:hypothetical protein